MQEATAEKIADVTYLDEIRQVKTLCQRSDREFSVIRGSLTTLVRTIRHQTTQDTRNINSLTEAIKQQTEAIKLQTQVAEASQKIYATSIPIRLVFYIIGIIAFAVLGVEAGRHVIQGF